MNQVKDFFEYILNSVKIWIIIQPWQQGIRVRNGNKVKILNKGIYFKIPYFDSIYVQEIKLRIGEVPMQTVTTKDLKTITIDSGVGYSISNINKLYDTLFHPETTVRNLVMSFIAKLVYNKNLSEIDPEIIEKEVIKQLKETDYGLEFEYFRITSFAVVRTYRLIQDQNWGGEALQMDIKK